VGVPEAADDAAPALAAVRVGAVRIAVDVRESVMLAVVGDPVDGRALDGHRAVHGQRDAHRSGRVERAVGQEAVVADRDTEAGDHVHDGEDGEVEPRDPSAPEEADRGDEAEKRKDHGNECHPAFKIHGLKARPKFRAVLALIVTSRCQFFCACYKVGACPLMRHGRRSRPRP
jgi:hypothetical protein